MKTLLTYTLLLLFSSPLWSKGIPPREEVNLDEVFNQVTVQVRNIMGQSLLKKTYQNTQRIEDEIRAAAGMYFVTVSHEGASQTFKILKN